MEQETKISELTELPGNLSLAALLAIVQGGVTYHATGEQVSNMVLGNISVTELLAIRNGLDAINGASGSFNTSTSGTVNHDWRSLPGEGNWLVSFNGAASNTEISGSFVVACGGSSIVAAVEPLAIMRFNSSFSVTVGTYGNRTAGNFHSGEGRGFRISIGATPGVATITWRAVYLASGLLP